MAKYDGLLDKRRKKLPPPPENTEGNSGLPWEGYYFSAYGLAVKRGYEGTEEEWLASLKGNTGPAGPQGQKGETGSKGDKGEKGETGEKGEKGDTGEKGETGSAGADGVSPVISSAEITGGHRLSIVDAHGTTTVDVMNGAKGDTGNTGQTGADGFSPTLSETKAGKVTTVTVTDAHGTHSFQIHDGADGQGSGDMLAATYDPAGGARQVAFADELPTVPTNVSAFTNDAGYLTSHQDISGKENSANKVTGLSAASTDTQYPSARCVYELVGNVEALLAALR